MVNLEIYRIFKVVAEEENLTKASEILYISQPAVTKHIKNLENFVEDPLLLKDVSPETLYCFLEKQGYTILPFAQSKTLTGIHYKDGGGFKVNWGGDRILQYHPATGSHHNGAYYKISSGKTGKVRIDLHGNKI